MNRRGSHFLLSEYQGLWSDAGVELNPVFSRALEGRAYAADAVHFEAETAAAPSTTPSVGATVPEPSPQSERARMTGPPNASLVFVEMGSDAPLSGPPGALFDKILAAMELNREQVRLIAAQGWDPSLLGMEKVVVAMGEEASQAVFGHSLLPIRGQWRKLSGSVGLATHHPRDLVLDPALKREVWQDMKSVMARLAR